MRRKKNTIFLVGLIKFLKDPQAQLRPTAARVLDLVENRSSNIIGSLVDALEIPGDLPGKRICDTLGQLTTRKSPYVPAAREAEKNRILQGWEKW